MTILVHNKNPVESSFLLWINQYPESNHPNDKERFLIFIKNICSRNAKKWKQPVFLKQSILEIKPNFDEKILNKILMLHEYLIDFYQTKPTPIWANEDGHHRLGHYLEKSIKNKKFHEEYKVLN